MSRTSRSYYRVMAAYAALIAASAYFGAIGMISGLLAVPDSLAGRLPFDSPVFGGIALALVVALPCTALADLAWRQHPRTFDAATLAGLALIGWIVIEVGIVHQFSMLQVAFATAGLGLVLVGNHRVLGQVADVIASLPLFMTAPLWRHWHARWGATDAEVASPMPGDELVPDSQFTATRAITINACPDDVWPWLTQVGFRRAGFYSYDLLDNLARPSADTVLPQWQHPEVGEIAAPMANPPTPDTSFIVKESTRAKRLLWAKPDSTWSWTLRQLPDGQTRLVTRLRQHYRLAPATLLTIILAEFGDFPMMRKMLLGIKQRAEATTRGRTLVVVGDDARPRASAR
jgi:hypothetical protein